jgi:AcrR family transcriptional regulator
VSRYVAGPSHGPRELWRGEHDSCDATVGAARTTVTEVARRSGVNRMTVYEQFPTEGDMVTACTPHWIELHPPWMISYRDAALVEPLAAIMDATWLALLDR